MRTCIGEGVLWSGGCECHTNLSSACLWWYKMIWLSTSWWLIHEAAPWFLNCACFALFDGWLVVRIWMCATLPVCRRPLFTKLCGEQLLHCVDVTNSPSCLRKPTRNCNQQLWVFHMVTIFSHGDQMKPDCDNFNFYASQCRIRAEMVLASCKQNGASYSGQLAVYKSTSSG